MDFNYKTAIYREGKIEIYNRQAKKAGEAINALFYTRASEKLEIGITLLLLYSILKPHILFEFLGQTKQFLGITHIRMERAGYLKLKFVQNANFLIGKL